MPSITVKNIPESAYETLKQIAVAHHRSINSEQARSPSFSKKEFTCFL